MDAKEFNQLIAEKPQDVKARGTVLYNASIVTMDSYNKDHSVANLRNMEAAKEALDKFIAKEGGGVTGDTFDNLMAVLEYLTNNGSKAARNSLYRHQSQGKLLPESGGKYKQRAVDKYAKTFLKRTATGKRDQESSDELQSQILQQNLS